MKFINLSSPLRCTVFSAQLLACASLANPAFAVKPVERIADPSFTEPSIRKEALAKPPSQKMELQPWQIPVLPAATNGGFIGMGKGFFLVAASASDGAGGGLTVWSLAANAKATGQEQWQNSRMAVPAWAASAQWGDAIIYAGGVVAGQPVNRVATLGITNGAVTETELPPLPKAVAGAGAAVIGNTLYVFGGASALAPAVFEQALWSLDLARPDATWVEAAPIPAPGRAFFATATQYDMLCVFGGAVAGADGKSTASKEAWAFRPAPLEGTRTVGWKRMADMPQAVTHAAAVAIGQSHVMLVGGEHRDTLDDLLAVTQDATGLHPLLLHTVTDAWCDFDQPIDLAAPLVVKNGADLLVLGSKSVAGKTATIAQQIKLPRTVRNLTWIDYLVIIFYFSFLFGIGIYFSRKQDSSAEFSLGNRQVKWWAAGISMFATAASAISFMAIPALAFATNLVWTLPLVMLVPAYFITGYFIFPLLRRMEITSTYEYLERRFNRPLRLIASTQCILFQALGRAGVVLVLPSLAISSVTGISVYTSVWVMGILTTIYTSLGGFEAVIWTEVFQGLLKVCAPIMMISICLFNLPHGPADFFHIGREYHKFDLALVTWDYTVPAIWILLTATLLQATVFQAGDQPVIQRVFSTPLSEVRRVTAMSMSCGIIIGAIVNVLGLSIFAYFHAHPEKFDPGAQNDQIVALFVAQALPTGVAGVVIAAIFASAMATVASCMNSVATVFTEDFYLPARPRATDQQRLRVLKLTSYVTGALGTAVALLLASLNLKSMMAVWTQLGALLGGGIVGVYTLGMFTRRTNGFGAVCGAITSIVVTLVAKLFTHVHWQALPPIAILSCMAAGYLMSFFAPQRKNLEGLTVFTPKVPAPTPSAA